VRVDDSDGLHIDIDVALTMNDYSPLLHELLTAGVAVRQISTEAPDLETTFLALTGRELRG
jgi:hypothetical protein